MCALSVASQLDNDSDLEWWMHFQIPMQTLSMFFMDGLEERPSTLPPSKKHPNMQVGTGLFTTKARKKAEKVCSFPGYWMHAELQVECTAMAAGDSYPFSVHERNGWPAMHNLVYMTHPCQANYINAGKIQDQVHPPTLRPPTPLIKTT